jgi:hypothetical protein
MWDAIGAIAGVVSALGTVISVFGLAAPQKIESPSQGVGPAVISRTSIYSFLLASSGWCLAVLSFLWIVQPYGRFVRKDDYIQVVGVVLALPALFVLTAGMDLISGAGARRDTK